MRAIIYTILFVLCIVQTTIQAQGVISEINSGGGNLAGGMHAIGNVFSSVVLETAMLEIIIDTSAPDTPMAQDMTLTIYPNPTAGELRLAIENYGDQVETLSFLLLDNQGRSIATQEIHDEETIINMYDMNSGLYILTISSPSQMIETFKILKN